MLGGHEPSFHDLLPDQRCGPIDGLSRRPAVAAMAGLGDYDDGGVRNVSGPAGFRIDGAGHRLCQVPRDANGVQIVLAFPRVYGKTRASEFTLAAGMQFP